MSDGTVFKSMRIGGWRQFASVDLQFHDRLTVITGANGSGKSTLLNILARHVGQERPYLGVPRRDSTGVLKYLSGRFSNLNMWSWLSNFVQWQDTNQIGEIYYSNGESGKITVPQDVGSQYQLEIRDQRPIGGIVISSHRLMSNYIPLENLPFAGVPPSQAFDMFLNEANQRYMGATSGRSLTWYIKQSLAAWAAIGEGNSVFQADPIQKAAYNGFIEILKKILPPTLGFISLSIRPPDVLLVTKSGEFLIDAASGGVTSLIEIGALIYAYSIRDQAKGRRFAVIYDEPENHLHPQLQRTLFRNLTEAFPLAQFIVATHSPFIVSSLRDSNVYVLRYEQSKDESRVMPSELSRIVSQNLDYANRAGTASEILREVLGLPSTLPEWVEVELNQVVDRYKFRSLDKSVLQELRTDLEKRGLADLFPEALVGLGRGQ